MPDWTLLRPPTPELLRARITLHYALQIPAAVGHNLVPALPDYSNTNFEWSNDLEALIGKPTPDGLRAGLRFADLTVLLLDANQVVQDEFALVGLTIEEGYARLERAVAPFPIKSPYELLDDPVAAGAPFPASDLYAELTRWYANSDAILRGVEAAHEDASPVRCWPHHFDIATLATLDPEKDPEEARHVGTGMTPGDHHIDEPYWYVTPWPYPVDPDLPPLEGGGHWITEGWLGAVLTGTNTSSRSAREQEEQIEAFLASAVTACRGLLGA